MVPHAGGVLIYRGVRIMRRVLILGTVFALVMAVLTPFMGGGGPGLAVANATSTASGAPVLAAGITAPVSEVAPAAVPVAMATVVRIDETAMIEQAKAEAAALTGGLRAPRPEAGAEAQARHRRWWWRRRRRSAPRVVRRAGSVLPRRRGRRRGRRTGRVLSPLGVGGTTSDDIASFAYTYNSIRVANCMEPVPYGNFYYDSCMESRLFWMAESPSEDPMDAWGHMGSVRIDGVPSPGCDGNLAGGYGNSGATAAWSSGTREITGHRSTSRTTPAGRAASASRSR